MTLHIEIIFAQICVIKIENTRCSFVAAFDYEWVQQFSIFHYVEQCTNAIWLYVHMHVYWCTRVFDVRVCAGSPSWNVCDT